MVPVTKSPMCGSLSSASCLSIWASCFFSLCTHSFKAQSLFQCPSAKSKRMYNGGRKKSDVLLDLLWTTRDVVQRLGGPSRWQWGAGQPQRAIKGKVCVCLSRKPTRQADAFRKNPNIFVRTLSDNRETPLSIFFQTADNV